MNPEICVLWVASDVLMCSASIWHMCTMSMDRYFTLKYPMRYGRNKTKSMVAGKILFVWVVSMAISSPICIHGFIDTTTVFKNGDCSPKLRDFLIYGSVFAFYIPLLIMIVTYVLTIRILWKNQQRMKFVDRLNFKPRLAQLTAQCTGFAIPKLLLNLRRSNKSVPASPASLSKSGDEKRPLAPNGWRLGRIGHLNSTVSETDIRANDFNMSYLALPSVQTCTRSSSPTSTNLQFNSDTEDSESEPNYFRLLKTSQSYRCLCRPTNLNTPEKSLHRRLQKKQLYHHQNQKLQLLQEDHHLQQQVHQWQEEQSSVSPSSPQDEHTSALDSMGYSTSPSPSLSPLFDGKLLQQQNQQQSLLTEDRNVCPELFRKASWKKNTSPTKRPSKKKRYSKRSKKQKSSFAREEEQCTHLKVPCQVLFRCRPSATKKNVHRSVLSSAVSDTQVCRAGLGLKSVEDSGQDKTPFHLSHTRDYKSLEWDRRYFQIQEEMDQCLMGNFSRWGGRQENQELKADNQQTGCHGAEQSYERVQKPLLKPENSLPVSFGQTIQRNMTTASYSRSAPNLPLQTKSLSSLKRNSSCDDEIEDNDMEEMTDRNNDDENDTSDSSNADNITIRLHPPTPKLKGSSSRISCSSGVLSEDTVMDESSQSSVSCDLVTSDVHAHREINSLVLTKEMQNLSPGHSPAPELVISSEGEMTLEETDDTLEDSPKLRQHQSPLHIKKRFPKQQSTSSNLTTFKKSVQLKRSSFRNTFRIHRGKGPVKHILSKKTASNEKKASKVLGIIFLVFVILWTPFFIVNILSASCSSCINRVTPEMMSLFLWMGYIASLANPIIYTMFNTAFRRTFIRILTCKIQHKCRKKMSDTTHYMSYTTMLASERRDTVTVVIKDE